MMNKLRKGSRKMNTEAEESLSLSLCFFDRIMTVIINARIAIIGVIKSSISDFTGAEPSGLEGCSCCQSHTRDVFERQSSISKP
jgi:hypothetical protein